MASGCFVLTDLYGVDNLGLIGDLILSAAKLKEIKRQPLKFNLSTRLP